MIRIKKINLSVYGSHDFFAEKVLDDPISAILLKVYYYASTIPVIVIITGS